MKVALRIKAKSPPEDTPVAAGVDRSAYVVERQAYLDALPVPAAVVGASRHLLKIVASNTAFARAAQSRSKDSDDLLTRVGASEVAKRVLSGESNGEQFEWRDGGLIDGRYYTVAISPVTPKSDFGRRVLVTLLERTGEVRAGESLRRQILTDPLSGLANRAGFVEGLELRIADDGSDLLGRTGANEFAIAVRLDDGPGDVLHIARRVEAALTQPFRLSDFEIKIDCAIGCALATDSGDNGDAETLIRHAQHALKTAKRTKRIEVYQPAALDAAFDGAVVVADVAAAVTAATAETISSTEATRGWPQSTASRWMAPILRASSALSRDDDCS